MLGIMFFKMFFCLQMESYNVWIFFLICRCNIFIHFRNTWYIIYRYIFTHTHHTHTHATPLHHTTPHGTARHKAQHDTTGSVHKSMAHQSDIPLLWHAKVRQPITPTCKGLTAHYSNMQKSNMHNSNNA